jgi:hypothetical protein
MRIEFSTFTRDDVAMAVNAIEQKIRRDPRRYLDERVTPFATVRQIMGGGPPSRWWLLLSPCVRKNWFARLHIQLTREIENQVLFAKQITGARH